MQQKNKTYLCYNLKWIAECIFGLNTAKIGLCLGLVCRIPQPPPYKSSFTAF